MDTSSNSDFRPIDLLKSGLPENRELYDKSAYIVQGIVNELKPLMKYLSHPVLLCHPRNYRCEVEKVRAMVVCGVDIEFVGKILHGDVLYLDESGQFFVAKAAHTVQEDKSSEKEFHYTDEQVGMGWQYLSFEMLVKSLKNALTAGIEKREKHLASLKTRHKKLDKILNILQEK